MLPLPGARMEIEVLSDADPDAVVGTLSDVAPTCVVLTVAPDTLRPGMTVRVTWGVPDPVQARGYGFDSRVVSTPMPGVARVAFPDRVERVERRRMVRVACDLELVVRGPEGRASGRCVDLSGAGVRAEISRSLAADALVRITLELHDQRVCTRGRVVASSLLSPSGHEVRLAFLHPDDVVEQAIVRFVLDRQRELIRSRFR